MRERSRKAVAQNREIRRYGGESAALQEAAGGAIFHEGSTSRDSLPLPVLLKLFYQNPLPKNPLPKKPPSF